MATLKAAVAEQAMKLLAADPTTFAPAADANKIVLVINDFAPSPARVVADFHPATFTGSTPLAIGLGTQPEGIDPITGDFTMDQKLPVGGLRWEPTDAVNLPQTVYGWVMLNLAGDDWLMCGKFAAPKVVNAVNQRVIMDADDVKCGIEAGSIH